LVSQLLHQFQHPLSLSLSLSLNYNNYDILKHLNKLDYNFKFYIQKIRWNDDIL
jgi:hypothetical protein